MIYCVEDESGIRNMMVYTLESAGLKDKGLEDGAALYAALKEEIPSLIILDIMLPDEDGISILKKLRVQSSTQRVPVIMATAKGSEYDKVIGLDSGADDYLVKGCSVDDVKARLDKAIARTKRLNTEKEQGLFRVSPDTTFNKNNRLLTISGKREELKSMESNILWLFCLRINEVIPTVEMCETLWGVDTTDKEKALTRYVCLLNKKLKADKSIAIQNEFARGYKLVNGF